MIRALPSTEWLRVALAAALLATAGPAFAAAGEPFKVVDGLTVYLGVLPAAMIQGHAPDHPEIAMHGGRPAGQHVYHIVVAVFEAKTGKRLADIGVSARVSSLGLAGPRKTLEAMDIADTVTYGNYFELSGEGLYDITIEVARAGAATPLHVKFTYEHRLR